jgi:hypothetical protein
MPMLDIYTRITEPPSHMPVGAMAALGGCVLDDRGGAERAGAQDRQATEP